MISSLGREEEEEEEEEEEGEGSGKADVKEDDSVGDKGEDDVVG